jgi:O-antigen ligase
MTGIASRGGDSASPCFAGQLLPALFAVLGPLVYVAPLGAVPGLLLLGLGIAVLAARTGDLGWRRIASGYAVFVPLLVWMLLSAVWALDGAAALSLALRLAGLFVVGVALVSWLGRLDQALLRACLPALALGFIAASAVEVIDLGVLDGFIIRALHAKQAANRDAALLYGRGATIQAMLTVPMLLGLWAQGARRLALMQLALGALAIFVTDSLSAKMALATALVVGAGVFAVPRLRFVILGVLVLGVLALPFVLPYRPDPATACRLANNKASALHRLYIWDFAAERIAERPILGWGLDGSRRLPGGDAPVIIRRCDAALQPVGNVRVDGTVMPLHPHNAILQVWLELGGIGAVLSLGTVLAILGRAFTKPAWRHRRALAAFAGAALAGLSVALVSFGIWQEWFLSSLFMTAAACVLAARQDASRQLRT